MILGNRYLLYYGGQEFELPASLKDFMQDLGDGPGTATLELSASESLTIRYGPGIAIALIEISTRTRPSSTLR